MTKLLNNKKDQLSYQVYSTRQAMGKAAANYTEQLLIKLQHEQDSVRIIFASAPSQNEFLAHLKASTKIDWSKVTAFHMDEYIGLPTGAEQAFNHFIKNSLLDEVKPSAAHFINIDAQDSVQECQRYAALLQQAPIDLVCLGVGENGHIAFNDPWVADFNDKAIVKKVQLDTQCRQQQVNDGCFAALDNVPQYALTLTIPTLVNAKHMVCIVPAATKREAITAMINGEISEDLPASILRKHQSAALFLDNESGADLL
ncbi:glucosamine-6-phosphate deaminase [Photobacterium kishitanii]|uniref:glucosamine-6-phosphate deaminase n=1 Tax=Photobacterium kishitanii TaxID=318456 RepID=UPI000D156DD7|nr:glucosamine-6-phosphate deaminase [Photobacterium kishitanii]PSV24730.1 glucosamine-6-phosphate deaminase [Photobacterium kishitanii]